MPQRPSDLPQASPALSRRDVLLSAARSAPALLAGSVLAPRLLAQAAAQLPRPAGSPQRRIVVTGGHPGDPEYGCGGTVARLTALGHEVVLLHLNDGAWPPTPAPVRIAEAAKAASLLGARTAYAGQQNGHAVVDEAHYLAFAKLLADARPDAVFTHWPIDNHRDHRAISNLTYDAWQGSGRAFALYYYEVSDGEDTAQFTPDRYVSIDGTEPQKRAACFAHASQAPDHYYPLQDAVARFCGIESGSTRAEAFVALRQNPFDLLEELRLDRQASATR